MPLYSFYVILIFNVTLSFLFTKLSRKMFVSLNTRMSSKIFEGLSFLGLYIVFLVEVAIRKWPSYSS